MDKVACVETAGFLANFETPEALAACAEVARSLRETGIVLLRDPRVSEAAAEAFLDLMEDYFAQETAAKEPDVKAELHYQVGATPENVEVPICKADPECQTRIEALPEEHRPVEIKGADPKWRFFWRIGERPATSPFEDLNAAPVLPAAFPEWETKMNAWGTMLHDAVTTCAEMAALGFGLERNAISDMLKFGPHLLAPTGSDLVKYNQEGIALAGWHNDLNLLTIHGKSRYPGLNAWLRDGTKMAVKIPPGCLLVQAGQQMEVLTGGAVQAGMHEVVVNAGTLAAAARAKEAGRPLWRISSTLFAHVASDQILTPLGDFATPEATAAYPAISAGEQVLNVLKSIALANP